MYPQIKTLPSQRSSERFLPVNIDKNNIRLAIIPTRMSIAAYLSGL